MFNKKVEYFLERAIYSIDSSSEGQLLIIIEDLQKSKSTLKLANPQLISHKTDTSKLYQQIYNQYIFDNKLPKRMLTCNANQIILTFDYPKPEIKSLKFPCQTVSQNEAAIQQLVIKKLKKEGAHELEKIFETYRRRIQQLATSKLQEVDQKMQSKMKQVSNKLELDSQHTISNILALYNSLQQEHNTRFNSYLASTMKKIEEINQLMIRQHRYAYQKLEDKVVVLNDNVKECYAKLNDLTEVIDINKTDHQDELRNLSTSVEEKLANFRWSIKEVKEGLGSRLDWIIELNHFNQEMQLTVKKDKEQDFILNKEVLREDLGFLTHSLLSQMQHEYIEKIKKEAERESQPIDPALNISI